MDKIKIIHVVEALGGGVYSYFCDLSKVHGNTRDVETIIVYSDKRSEIIPEKVATDFHKSMRLIPIEMSESIQPIKDYKSLRLLRQIFCVEKPDVIHVHSSKAGVLGKIAASAAPHALLYYTPHGYSFLKKDISKTKAAIFKKIEEFMASYNNCVTIACGDTELSYAQQLHKKVKLIRNGVPYNEVIQFHKDLPSCPLTVGILGRVTHARNPDLFNDIAMQFPHINFKWIGDGILRERLTAKNIEVTGWFMERSDGLKQLNNMHIYLQTSLWEGLPIAVLEAMALGKPVVASNVIGNKDVVIDQKTGFLFNDKAGAISALESLISSAHMRDTMGNKGKNRVRDHFNSSKNYEKLLDLYRDDYASKC